MNLRDTYLDVDEVMHTLTVIGDLIETVLCDCTDESRGKSIMGVALNEAMRLYKKAREIKDRQPEVVTQ